MLKFIESTGMIIDFDQKYLMRRSKEYIQSLYNAAIDFIAKKMNVTITLEGKVYNINELTAKHFNKKYYDEETGFEYVLEIRTNYLVDYTQKNGIVCKNVEMNRLTYVTHMALGTPITVKNQWKEIVKDYIYD